MSINVFDESDDAFNPFQAPVSRVAAPGPYDASEGLEGAEATRRKHLNREMSFKAIGILNTISALLFFLLGLAVMAVALGLVKEPGTEGETGTAVPMLVGGLLFSSLGGLLFLLGRGMSRLRPWARIAQGVLSTLAALASLVGFNPIALLFHGYLAYLALSDKGGMICSPEYRRVIEATPHIKFRLNRYMTILTILALALFLLAVARAIWLFVPRE
jgi:hypothetical protein